MVRRDVPPVSVRDEKLLFDLIRASFNERRKTLQNGITNYAGFSFSKEEALRAIEACGFKPTVRGEALTLSEFGRLADELCLIRGQRNRQD
jgi:16S rRNA (adenine1518-N6/adenine1519-N6)-dimethyltransferase